MPLPEQPSPPPPATGPTLGKPAAASRPAPRGSISVHPLAAGVGPQLPGKMDEAAINLLADSFARIAARGDALAVVFYDRLFAAHPHLRTMFPADMTSQRGKLIESLRVVVGSLRRPAEVRERLRSLGAHHAAAGVRSEQYPIVCRMMVQAMAEVAGPDWSPTLEQEWSRALELISRLMLEGAASPPATSRP